MEWSKLMQTPEYLEATRMTMLTEDFLPLTVKWCGIRDGMKVLDVGCGTGCFLRYLSGGTENVDYTGLEIESEFLKHTQPVHGKNTAHYVEGSAYEMPFADESFDRVVSHTFFNCAADPERATAEMKRVCRNGGKIAAVVPMSLGCETWNLGYYPEGCVWVKGIRQFQARLETALSKKGVGIYDFNKGIPASRLPRFFHVSGLKEIEMYPLPRTFSLSNHAVRPELKKAYVENLYTGEKKRLENAMELGGLENYISPEECREYLGWLKERRDFRMAHLEENEIWEWTGGSSVLIVGRKEE